MSNEYKVYIGKDWIPSDVSQYGLPPNFNIISKRNYLDDDPKRLLDFPDVEVETGREDGYLLLSLSPIDNTSLCLAGFTPFQTEASLDALREMAWSYHNRENPPSPPDPLPPISTERQHIHSYDVIVALTQSTTLRFHPQWHTTSLPNVYEDPHDWTREEMEAIWPVQSSVYRQDGCKNFASKWKITLEAISAHDAVAQVEMVLDRMAGIGGNGYVVLAFHPTHAKKLGLQKDS